MPAASKVALLGLFMISLLTLAGTLSGCASKHVPPRPAVPGSIAESIIQTALSQSGRSYVWGGSSPNTGFDCSGLVTWVYRQNGFSLPRITRDQFRQGVSVPLNQLQAADLVFFRIGKRGSYHVGIATGRGTFIHSPKPGTRVREENLFIIYWQQRLIGVRRIVSS